jgi:DNA-binding NtrC family response regulator
MNGKIERQRVLVVDDDAATRALVADALTRASLEPKTAETGERALLILRQWPRHIDWLITKTKLLGLVDGSMLADEFHQAHPGRPVLLASRAPKRPSQAHVIVVDPASPATVVETLQGLTPGAAQPPQNLTAWAA